MARGGRRKGERDTFAIANTTLPNLVLPRVEIRPVRLPVLAELEYALPSFGNRRRWHPERLHPAGAMRRAADRLVAGRRHTIRFAVPDLTAICLRRKIRREVLFARRSVPLAGVGTHSRRRNFWSSISCKR